MPTGAGRGGWEGVKEYGRETYYNKSCRPNFQLEDNKLLYLSIISTEYDAAIVRKLLN